MSEEKTLSILNHILALFLWVLGPIIILLTSQNKKVKAHAKKALNWQISFTIYLIISFILMFILIGFLLMAVLYVLNIIFCIIAAVKANEGQLWDYPLSIKFFK